MSQVILSSKGIKLATLRVQDSAGYRERIFAALAVAANWSKWSNAKRIRVSYDPHMDCLFLGPDSIPYPVLCEATQATEKLNRLGFHAVV